MHVNGQHYYAILKADNDKYLAKALDKDGKELGYRVNMDVYKRKMRKKQILTRTPYMLLTATKPVYLTTMVALR